jgi:acyl-CoA hydrolase
MWSCCTSFTVKAFGHDEAGKSTTRFRHRVFFVGTDMRAALKQGLVDYVPMSVARVPEMIALGRIPVNVALIQVSLPDAFGYVSLGVSVDIIPAAIARAKVVIAEVNPNMPRTMGDSTLHISRIHHLVAVNEPITELARVPLQEDEVQRIARYIAGIIDDGSTLQIGLGQVAHEALQHLTERKDLGVHSDLITTPYCRLLEKGCLTGAQKSRQRFKIVASMAIGSRALYDLIDNNPLFDFRPIEAISNPVTIAAQHKMVAIAQAAAIDLTGQVCIDQFGGELYGGLGSQSEFLRGASRSPGGKPIVCMTSTYDDGEQLPHPAVPAGRRGRRHCAHRCALRGHGIRHCLPVWQVDPPARHGADRIGPPQIPTRACVKARCWRCRPGRRCARCRC